MHSRQGTITSFDPVGSVTTFGDARGINRSGTFSGGYIDADGVAHGFVRDAAGAITSFDAPGAGTAATQGTTPISINSASVVMGTYVDSNGASHGFLRIPEDDD